MIQITKNYCHTIEASLNLTTATAFLIQPTSPLPQPVLLDLLNSFFLANSYVSKSYLPDHRDKALLNELSNNTTAQQYQSWANVQRWGDAVSEILG